MRKILITCFGIFISLSLLSQKTYSDTINSAIGILKIHESTLSKLSPFDDENGMDQIVRLNGKVIDQLLYLLSKKEAVNMAKDSLPFFSGESSDKNLAVFSWEENLGGSFRQFLNVFYWKNLKGKPQAKFMDEEQAPFTPIHVYKNKEGEVFYLLTGGTISCNTCRMEKVLLLKINDTDIEEVFSMQIDYRFNHDIDGFSFDKETQILSYEYVEDDCEDDEGENCWIRGKLKFDGKTLIEIE